MFKPFKRIYWKTGVLMILVNLLVFTITFAAPGDLDTTFHGDGRVTLDVNPRNPGRYDVVSDVAIQPDGKILAAGYSFVPSTSTQDFALTRWVPSGNLDATFGRRITDFGGEDQIYDVAIQTDGKILVAGRKCISGICDVALARYNSTGSLDTTFSGDGKQTTNVPPGDNGSLGGLAIQPDGKILVAGYAWNNNDGDYDYAIYRYNANGSLDMTFSANGDGVAVGNFGSGRQDFATDLVIQSDGKIVFAGHTGTADYQFNNFAIGRLDMNGRADITFSGDGWQITDFDADDFAYGLALHQNGRIVAVGKKATANFNYFAVARYKTTCTQIDPDRCLDTTFNGTGKKVFSIIPGRKSWAEDVIVQSNNKIVIVGTTYNESFNNHDFALVRMNQDGSFDFTFSGNGKTTVDFGGQDYAYSLVRQPTDGKYVLGGYTDNAFGDLTHFDFALARVLP